MTSDDKAPELHNSLYYRKKYRGLIGVRSKMPIRDTSVLSRLYTPGVGACCLAIADNDDASFDLSCRGNNVALVSDASALYALGNVPPEAALPVMEAQSVLFKHFANIDAFPMVMATKDLDEIAEFARLITPTFGGIVLTDIAAPKCFTIELRLRRALNIPVLDSDQHATGIAVAAAVLNALKIVKKDLAKAKIVINGAGAGGAGTARRLLKLGAKNIILCDRAGAVHTHRMENMNWAKLLLARRTNPERLKGSLEEVVKGADVLIGLSAPGCVSIDMVRSMAKGAIVFALSNPDPEITPSDAEVGGAAVYACGTNIHPVQIRASMVAPGFMRGCLDARVRDINNDMFNAVTRAYADMIPKKRLSSLYFLPDTLDLAVGPTLAEAVVKAAIKNGMAGKALPEGVVGARLKSYLYEGERAWYDYSDAPTIHRGTGIDKESLEIHHKYQGCVGIEAKIPVRDENIFDELYSPRASAEPVKEIIANPAKARDYTAKSNLVGVVSDGSAVLGFGNIGPWAALPVMEGKAILFKTFGGVEAYPLCLSTQEPHELINAIAKLSTAFGGINLEDIAAPRCFEVERKLQAMLDIPVFHDDQHGTAVVALAGVVNAMKIRKTPLKDVRIVINGAGAAATAVALLLVDAGAVDITVCDRAGAIYKGRKESMNQYKDELAARTNPKKRKGTMPEVLEGADVFLGLSVAGALTQEMVKKMAKRPVIFAMANPTPEILPSEAKAAGAFIVATGRSDFPNQVNNCLAFPGIFRGALDVAASRINEEMKLAAAYAISGAIPDKELGPDKIIPLAMDFSVPPKVAEAVAAAAIKSGVARLKVDPKEISRRLTEYIYEERFTRD